MPDDFFRLVRAALPREVKPQELIRLAPAQWWENRPCLATAYALRKCDRINWQAYLEAYPDVRESGMDACLHFLKHGIYEGRRLTGIARLASPEAADAPLVSIVIINFNNAHLLPKSLGSAMSQTLKNIEIIVVDDASTDGSQELVRQCAARDHRVRLIVNRENSATLIARKRGVEAATGRYLMLLDSDDYMAENACEVAAREIAKGYDMVKFGASVVNSLNAPADEIIDSDNFCNRGEPGEYFNDEIVTNIFRDGKISWHVWSFIYQRELCQNAFAELPDQYITGPDDLYALLAIARSATSMLKIPDRLYFYNYGPGVSVTVDRDVLARYAPARADAILAISSYARKHSLNINIDNLYRNLCVDLLGKFIAISDNSDVSAHFIQLGRKLGAVNVVQGLFQRNYGQPEKLANLPRPTEARTKIRHLGLFFPSLNYGGGETLVQNICSLLPAENYRLTLFLEERTPRESAFAECADLVHIGPFIAEKTAFHKRLLNLEEAVKSTGIDAMLYCAPHSPALLWDALALRLLDIPLILWQRLNFCWALSESRAWERSVAEKIYRNVDGVICQPELEELYLRNQGINATCIPCPSPAASGIERAEIPTRIAVLCRPGDRYKQLTESLKVMRQVVKSAPWVSMCVIGDLYTSEQMDKYRKKLREFGLERHVTMTGWTDDPARFLKECGALLSVSAFESFGANISEAQALGLPCVIYDVPLEQSRDNPSIIAVPQGNYEAAAAEILSLLTDTEKWHRLSRIALVNSARFSPEKFAASLRYYLENFQRLSPWKPYTASDYQKLLRYTSYYSGRRFKADL